MTGGSSPTMSRCTWLNLADGMAIFSTVMVGCLVNLALLQAAHSLHQVSTSVARPCQTKQAAPSQRVACCPSWESPWTCSNTVLLWEAGPRGQKAPVEVLHQSLAPWYTTISSSRPVWLVSTSCISRQVNCSRASSAHLMGPCWVAGTTVATAVEAPELPSRATVAASEPEGTFTLAT